MKLFNTRYDYAGKIHCDIHPDYDVTKKPDNGCDICNRIWHHRCASELGYSKIIELSASEKSVALDGLNNYILYWEESGKCKCISSTHHNIWFTVDELEGFYTRYSMVLRRPTE